VKTPLIPFEEFWPRVAAQVTPLEDVRIALAEAGGRILRRPALAVSDLPRFDNAAMDGFALRAVDAVESGFLSLAESSAYAGEGGVRPIEPGTAVPVGTGGPVPPGADAVLVKECAEVVDRTVQPTRKVNIGDNIRCAGEEFRKGETLLEPGFRLHPRAQASLAAAGVREVVVGRRPRVAVIPTGNELAPPGAEPAASQIFDANGPFLQAALESLSGERPLSGWSPTDDRESLTRCFQEALEKADVLVVTGGVSVGDRDLVKTVLEDECGVERLLWRVSVKPGKPVYVGRAGERWVLGLPGNPASTVVHWHLLVKPLLLALQGASDPAPPRLPMRLRQAVKPDRKRTRLHWSGLSWQNDGPWAEPLDRTGSHMLSRLSIADVLAIMPPGTEPVPAGSLVEGVLLEEG